MQKFSQRQARQIVLACGMMLMMGWFTLWSGQMMSSSQVSQSDLEQVTEVPVLMYHHLLPEKENYGIFADNNIVVTVEKFRQQMEYLKSHGYHTISLAQLQRFVAGEETLPAKSVVITFDDGYLSNYIYGYPILKEMDYRGVMFLLTSVIQQEPQPYSPRALQYLSWPEIEQMKDCIEFGSHTDQLHRLNFVGKGVLTDQSPEEIITDLQQTRNKMGDTAYYCYPYGHYSQRVMDTLQQQGIKLAFTIGAKNVCAGDNPLALNRWDMYQYDIEEVLE